LQQALAHHDWLELRERGQRLLALFAVRAPSVQQQLSNALRQPVLQVLCLRDIWHDHVLFTGDRVTGLVDFGALRWETVAGDLARLLGSLVGDDRSAWQQGLAAYQEVRPLEPAEAALVEIFDASGVLLGGLQWIRWIAVEGRTFPNRQGVILRLDEILRRLEQPATRPLWILSGEP
jgi:Ser/Thr protein kinase RdoA (MazF antagonist)